MSLLNLYSLREPRANQISTSIYFYSPKLNRQVWCESNLEWDTAIVLDHDPSVVEYCEQAINLQWSKSTWVPDFVAIIEDEGKYKAIILEVKYMEELLGDKDHYIQKYSESQQWIDQNFSNIAEQISSLPIVEIELIIVTDLILQQSFYVRNLRKLIQAKIENQYEFALSLEIEQVLEGYAQIPIETLINAIMALHKRNKPSKDQVYSTLYTMLYNQEVYIDFNRLIAPKSLLFAETPNKQTLNQWLKRTNWEEVENIYPSMIKHIDLYFVANSPEKSIRYWQIANDRLQTINGYLETSIEELKSQNFCHNGKNISWKTAYRWIKRYKRAKGDIRSLIPKYTNCGGKIRYNSPVAEEIWEFGKNQYLQRERKSIQLAYNNMKAYATKNDNDDQCMCYSSFYKKIQRLNRKEVAIRRTGKRNAEKEFELSESEFPHADYPLQSVQIDHTPIDVLVVDDENRKVTERPYLTIAFDSHTRCILGYYITYNKPSRLTIAMTLLNCVQNKTMSIEKIHEQFPDLEKDIKLSINSSKWKDVYGLPYTLHMDNGSDFRSNDIKLFGARYKVHLHYRAVKKPQHGAYVERCLGTLNKRLHGIAGTTFSNVMERKDYPSEKRAIYTIKELEARVLMEILLYHEDYHHQIRTAPIQKWLESFSNTTKERAISHNISQIDLNYFHLDVLPSTMRTIQKKGVQLFGLGYADPRIQKWIGAKDTSRLSGKRSFLIRYDPRDIRTIFFFDPEEKGYLLLKCSDRFVRTYYQDQLFTLWQWQSIKNNYRALYSHPAKNFNQKKQAYLLAQQSMDKEAGHRTKSIRIKRSRHRLNQEQQIEFSSVAGLLNEENNNIEEIDFSELDDVSMSEDEVERIYVSGGDDNPFTGFSWDIEADEVQNNKQKNKEDQ
jgi:putative transposase